MDNKIKVIVFNVAEKPNLVEIDNTLESLKKIVGGYIEMVRLPNKEDLVLICNEEGKLIGLPPQLQIGQDVICGNFLIAKDDGLGELISLNANDLLYLQQAINFTL